MKKSQRLFLVVCGMVLLTLGIIKIFDGHFFDGLINAVIGVFAHIIYGGNLKGTNR